MESNKKNNKKAIVCCLIVVILIGVFVVVKNLNTLYPTKNIGVYSNYISSAIKEHEKGLTNTNSNPDNYIYQNVIYENIIEKSKLTSLKDNDIIAEYLVCLVAMSADEIDKKYYACKIPYYKYTKTLNDQLEIAKGLDYQSIISDGIRAGTDIAGAISGTDTPKEKTNENILKKVGGEIGSIIGNMFGAKEDGEEIGKLIGNIAPSVIDGIKNLHSNIKNQFENNAIKLKEFIEAMPEEDYVATLNDFSSIIVPDIELIAESDLNKYLSSKDINLLNKTIKKYNQ